MPTGAACVTGSCGTSGSGAQAQIAQVLATGTHLIEVDLSGGTPGVATLAGVVWEDLNHTRTLDAGDPVESGWLVEVLHGGVVVASQRTGADGTYSIPNLTPGSGYQVRFRRHQR